ncbi:MAG: hypothetical protein CFE43_03000 [Burkholderiales bacterium PBB3]|nr:MAG: hypothetical protein CFE43_03000 [Burkholderiales bacterium PBB3]
MHYNNTLLRAVTKRLLSASAKLAIGLTFWVSLALPSAQAATPQRVAVGYNHTLAITSDGALWTWGDNGYGQLGNGNTIVSASPIKVGTGFVQAHATGDRSFAIKADGTLWAWGNNAQGRLGDGSSVHANLPVLIGTGFAYMNTTEAHTLAIKSDGTLWAWGTNTYGQLGTGNTTDTKRPMLVGSGFAQANAGLGHSVAVKTDGTLWAWGLNSDGQLGDGTTTNTTAPVQIGSGMRQAFAGYKISYALRADGALFAWGRVCLPGLVCPKVSGPFGPHFSPPIEPRPSLVSGGWLELSTESDYSTLAKRNDGVLVRFSGVFDTSPTEVFGAEFSEVALGLNHTATLKADGSFWTTGSNAFGKLGVGSMPAVFLPVQIGTGFQSVVASVIHALAIQTDGSLWAWGDNMFGALGCSMPQSGIPTQIGGGFAKISTEQWYTFAIKTDGTLWAWGQNPPGSGVGNSSSCGSFIGSDFAEIATASYRTLGVKTDGSLWAWGTNGGGQVGDGTTTDADQPVKIGEEFTKVAANMAASYALKADASLWAWELGEARVENGLWKFSGTRPRQIATDIAQVAANGTQAYVITRQGALWALGCSAVNADNCNGVEKKDPILLGQGYAQVNGQGLAVKSDGSLWSLTTTNALRFGSGNNLDAETAPHKIGEGYAQVTAANNYVLGVKRDGTLWGWGANEYGQLGQPHGPSQLPFTPVQFQSAPTPPTVNGEIAVAGSPQNLTMTASLVPDPAHTQGLMASQGNMFFIAILPDGRVFTNTLTGWLPLDNVKRESYGTGLRKALVNLLIGVDTADLKGTHIYLGYGLGNTATESWDEMLASQRFKLGMTL